VVPGPTGSKFPRLRVIVLVIACLIVVCGGTAVFELWWNFGVDHTRASSTCASCAVDQFLASGPIGGLTSNAERFNESTCGSQRPVLTQQMQSIATSVDRATTGTPWSLARTEVGASDTSGSSINAHVRLIFGRSGSTETLATDVGTWTFTMTHSDGWQVCGLQTPELCDTYLNCTHDSAPSGPSPSPSGLLSNLDPLQRCGPKDPFREYHDCPSPPPTP
jgi:hypothetical protein